MEVRNRLLGSAALAVGCAFGLRAVEQAFRLSDVLDRPHPTGLVVAECLDILQFLVLGLASLFAAQAFFSLSGDRHERLRDAAALLAAAFGFGLLSAAFAVGVDFSETYSSAYRVAGVLDGVFAAALAIAALLAVVGFSQRDRGRRDYFLGWTGIAFMAANIIGLTAGLLRSEGYTDQNGFGTLTFALNLGTTGLLAAAVAGAIAGFAFFDAARVGGSVRNSVVRRDLLLAVAAGVYAFFAVVFLASEAISAIARSDLGYSGAENTSSWIAALAAIAPCAAAVCVIAALQPAFARALQRVRTASPSDEPSRSDSPRERDLDLTILYEDGEEGWIVASIPAVPGALGQGRSRAEARDNVLDALALMLSPEPGEKRERELLHLKVA